MRAVVLILSMLVAVPALAAESDDDDSADEDDPEDEDENENEDEDENENENENEDEDGTPEITETLVVTATGEPRVLSEAPIPVRVIDEETIRRSSAADAADLLQRAPGIPVLSHGVDSRGGVSGISLQGVPAGRTLVLIDGRPIAGDVGGIVDLSQFPADMLERVEIVEGPMSALYGSDALGGVVNLITRKPRPGTEIGGRLRLTSVPSLDLAATLASSPGGEFQWGSSVTAQLADAIDLDPEGLATDLDRRKSVAFRLFASLRRERDRLDLSAMASHDARDGVTVRRNEAIDHTEVHDSRKRHDRVDASLAWLHRYEGLGSTRIELNVTDFSFGLQNDLRDSPVDRVRRARTWAVEGRFRFDLRYVPWGALVAGLEGRVEGVRVLVDDHLATGDALRLEEVAPTVEASLEPWVQGDLQFGGGRVEVVPGIRLSLHDAYPPRAGEAPPIAPSLAIRVDLWKNASLRMSGGRGYRAPSLKERYLRFDHAALGYLVVGDPDLRPESSWGANASLEQRFGTHATVRVGGYVNRLQDLITYVYDPAESSDGLNVYVSTNVDGAKTYGGKATFEVRYPWIRATGAYRFLWAVADDGFFLPDSAIHALRGTLELTLAKFELSLYNSVAWESERFVDRAQQLRSPGLVRWDVKLEKRFTGRHELAVFVGVDNLLNQRREPDREGDFRPVEGRTVLAGVRGSLRLPRSSD